MPQHNKGPSRLWWVYFVYVVAACLYGLYLLVRQNAAPSVLGGVMSLIDIAGAVGLFAYIRNVAALVAGFWRFIFLLCIMQVTFGVVLLAPSLLAHPWHNAPVQRMAVVLLLSYLSLLPMVYAIGRYAFGSPHLWGNVQSVRA